MLKLISIFGAVSSLLSYGKNKRLHAEYHSYTPDKELNILIYRMLSYVIIYKSCALLKMVRFFGCLLYTSPSPRD